MFTTTARWAELYPGASVGVLAMSGVANPKGHAAIEARKLELEADLRTRFAGFDRSQFKELPRIKAYDAYYGKFGKSYHVLLQLESIVLKGKHLPSAGSLVDTMFAAELHSTLLTAGHDLDSLALPLVLSAANGDESYTLYNGKSQILKAEDMYISDSQGVVSSILHGPDQRTRIKDDTQRVLFAVYAPPGIDVEAVKAHLAEIRDGAMSISPTATVELMEVFAAGRAT